MRISIFGILALALFATGVSAQPRCVPYPAYPTRCLRPVADGWYLAPGVGRQRSDGMVMANGIAVAGRTVRLQVGTTGPSDARGAVILKDHGLYRVNSRSNRWLAYRARLHGSPKDRSPEITFMRRGGLQRQISLASWRGKRIQVALGLKNADGSRGYVSAWMGRGNETALRTASLLNRQNGTGWERHVLVLDAPDDATDLLLFAGLTGRGEIEVSDITVQAADRNTPLTWTERIDNTGNFGELTKRPLVPPSPGPVRPDEG